LPQREGAGSQTALQPGTPPEEAAFITRFTRNNRRGCHVEAALSLPRSANSSVFAAGDVILRGDSSEANAQIELIIKF